MRAAILEQIREPLRVMDVPEPELGPEEVLVKTRACGICGTDLHMRDGLTYAPPLPHILGHEPAGVVARVGEDVGALTVGQRVVPNLFFTCGECSQCLAGRDSLCTRLKGLLGVTVDGAFAEYFKAPEDNLFILPDNVSFEIGGLISCAVVTALHATRRAQLLPEDSAVVLGAGGVGQILIQLLKAEGIRVIALSRSNGKLEMAERLGADLVLNAEHADVQGRVKSFTGGDGADCVFDCVGSSVTMGRSATYVMEGGRIVVIGEEAELPKIDTTQIAQRELEIIGTRNGTKKDTADAIAMASQGILEPPIARTFQLDQINEALGFMETGRTAGRIVIVFDAS